jgi:predicted nucleic acid-binding protein
MGNAGSPETGIKVVIDTNILVDYLRGLPQAQVELARYARPGISLITWMEVMIGAKDKSEEAILRGFLGSPETLPITDLARSKAVAIFLEQAADAATPSPSR